jgi:hypothetical protein
MLINSYLIEAASVRQNYAALQCEPASREQDPPKKAGKLKCTTVTKNVIYDLHQEPTDRPMLPVVDTGRSST